MKARKKTDRDLATLTALTANSKSRRKFLESLALEPPDLVIRGVNQSSTCLTLSTIHSAKGREFEAVFVLNAVEYCLPSVKSLGDKLEEERRLLYVAMTRAKRQLTIMLPKEIEGRDQPPDDGIAVRTRFIPSSVVDHFARKISSLRTTEIRLTFLD